MCLCDYIQTIHVFASGEEETLCQRCKLLGGQNLPTVQLKYAG